MKHGQNGYTNYGCRCGVCRDAQAAYHRAWKAKARGTLAPDDSRHGTPNGYANYSCRCLRCTEAAS